MRSNQSLPMMLTISKLKNAISTNQSLNTQSNRPRQKNPRSLKKSAKFVEKNGHSISQRFKRQTKNYHGVNLETRQQYDAQLKPSTQKKFQNCVKNKQGLSNRRAPITYVSPDEPYNRSSSQSPFRNQNLTSRQKSSSYDN